MLEFLDLDNLDIPSLQNATLAYLEKVKDFIEVTITKPEIEESKRSEYESDLQQIKEQIKLVEDLKLRMMIIAPMKAGKSTIINALIGQEIMPSHSDAMTILPTDIVFNPTLTEPILKLSDETLQKFKTTISTIKNQGTLEWAKQETRAYPQLEKLLEEIHAETLQFLTEGAKAILNTLTNLNHVIRLCWTLAPEHNPFQDDIKDNDFPCVETPFWTFSRLQQQAEPIKSKLVIVDTAGQDEAGPNQAAQNQLKELLESQLKKTSLVLQVIDYNKLRSQEQQNIKGKVEKFIALPDKTNVHFIVNQIDARDNTSGHHKLEKLQQIIKKNYELPNDNQVFEVSGLWALLAINVMRALEDDPDPDPNRFIEENLKKTENIIHFAKNIYGLRWQQQLNSLKMKELKSDAEQVWTESCFANLIKQLFALFRAAEHHCMRTAMDIASEKLRKVCNISSPLAIDKFKTAYSQLS